MDGGSLNITAEKTAQLKQLFPEIFAEDKIDWERLRLAFGEDVFVKDEHYELSWAGKADARKEIQKPTTATATLRPKPDESVRFETTGNVFIAGENLEALRVLQRSYFGKVKLIYIDPPYNTGSDSFVYPDDYAERKNDYEQRAGLIDARGFLNKQDLWKKNAKENGQFHSVWLSMMFPRLYLARNLLREDGVIFVSIDDNEAANLKLLLDEIFGEENFVGQLVWEKKKKGTFLSNQISRVKEYVLLYAKNILNAPSFIAEINTEIETYPCINPSNRRSKRIFRKGMISKYKDKNITLAAGTKISASTMDIIYTTELLIREGLLVNDVIVEGNWRYGQELIDEYAQKGELYFTEDLYIRRIVKEPRYKILKDLLPRVGDDEDSSFKSFNVDNLFEDGWGSNEDGAQEFRDLFDNQVFVDYPKPKKLIAKLIATLRDKDALILDFFAGSGTTAQAVLDLNQEDGGNRKFLLIQLPEPLDEQSEAFKAGYKTIADICAARIKKVLAKFEADRRAALDFGGNAPDWGFRAYALDSSNFKAWRSDVAGEDAILGQMALLREPLAEYRDGDDAAMLTELCLKAGLPLSVDAQERQIDGCKIYDIERGTLWVALERVTLPLFRHIAEAKPGQFVTLSSLFAGEDADETLSNATLQLHEADVKFTII